jgi:spore coat-associated protein N
MEMKNVRKSLVAAFLLTMVGALLIGGATVAWFTSEDSNTENSFAAGTFEISLDKDDTVEKYFNITNTFPGDTGSAEIVVTNNGSLPLKYYFTLATSGDLFKGQYPVVIRLYKDGNEITDLTAERELASGKKETFNITYEMPELADNSYQGAMGSLDISVTANQTNR